MQADTMRETQMNVRLTADEAARVAAVAEHYGLSGPNLVRMLIKREADALGITAKTAGAPKRGKR